MKKRKNLLGGLIGIMLLVLLVLAGITHARWRLRDGWATSVERVCTDGMTIAYTSLGEPDTDWMKAFYVPAEHFNGGDFDPVYVKPLSLLGDVDSGPWLDDLPANLSEANFIVPLHVLRWNEPDLDIGDYVFVGTSAVDEFEGGRVVDCPLSGEMPAPTLYSYGNDSLPVSCDVNSDSPFINFPAGLTIFDVDVALYVESQNGQATTGTLVAPSGATVPLFTDLQPPQGQLGTTCTADETGFDIRGTHPDVVLDDSARETLADGYPSDNIYEFYFRPEGALASLEGQPAKGAWRLAISGGDIQCWCLDITGYRTVGFTNAEYEVSESTGAANIEVALSDTSNRWVEVDYEVIPDPGSDQQPRAGTLTFPPRGMSGGDGRALLAIPIADDGIEEADEALTVRLSDPSNQYGVGALGEATILILDDDGQEVVLDLTVVGNGAVTVDPDKPLYETGETVQLTAVPDAGSIFQGWSGDLEGTQNPATVVMDGNREIIATFVEQSNPPTGEHVLSLPLIMGAAGNDRASTRSASQTSTPDDLLDMQLAIGIEYPNNHEIVLVDGYGDIIRNISQHPAHDIGPSWAPDGSSLLFQSNRDGNWEIYQVQANGSGLRKVMSHPADDFGATFSPDGSKIAFKSRRGGVNLYVMNANGTGLKLLSEGVGNDWRVSWSPDGRQLAFSSKRDGNEEIYVINADGSGLRRVTNNRGSDTDPTWTPDGSRILFVSEPEDYGSRAWPSWGRELFLIRPDGTGLERLTFNFANDTIPDWSPDGSIIAFSREDSEGEDKGIYLMNSDGTNIRRITPEGQRSFWSIWRP